MDKTNKNENINNDSFNEDEVKDAIINTNEREIRFSRESSDYVYSDGKGQELSLYVLKTMNVIDMQIEPSDDQYYDYVIDEHSLADSIETPYKNLHQAIVNGDFIWKLMNSKFIDQELNDKGEIEYINVVNVMSSVKYDEKNGKIYFRKNPDMSRFQLMLGKNNPYYANSAKLLNSLKTPKKIELYRLIEDELSYLQYKLGMKTKYQMLNDHKWHEIYIPIVRIRKKTFTLDKYPDNNVFTATFIKRQLEEISDTTDIQIDTGIDKETGKSKYRTDAKGKNAEFLILFVRRKEILPIPVISEEDNDNQYFEDYKLNKIFIKYMEKRKIIDEEVIKIYKERLESKAGKNTEGNINVKNAIKIVENSIMGEWKNFYPLSDEEKIEKELTDKDIKYYKQQYYWDLKSGFYQDISFEEYLRIKTNQTSETVSNNECTYEYKNTEDVSENTGNSIKKKSDDNSSIKKKKYYDSETNTFYYD